MQTTLTLAEELLLLALDDPKGTIPMTAAQPLKYGLAGATIMDLMLIGKLTNDDKNIVAVDATLTGNEIQDQVLTTIAAAERPRDVKYWVGELGTDIKRHQDWLEERLVQRGILRREVHRFLGIIPSQRYPTDDPLPEQSVRERIRTAVLGDASPDPRTATLISIAKACSVLDNLFTREECKQTKRRVEEIIQGETLGKAVKDTVDAINAAANAAAFETMLAANETIAATRDSSS
jgi:golgi phosphoprotein 3